MDFLHQKLLQARTKDQEDKIVNWMLAEAQLKQAAEKNNPKSSLDTRKDKVGYVSENKMNNQHWSYGDTKIDRQGRTIYFIEYANQKDKQRE